MPAHEAHPEGAPDVMFLLETPPPTGSDTHTELLIALIGGAVTIILSIVSALLMAWLSRRKTTAETKRTDAEAGKANAEAGLAEANALTLVIDGLQDEVTRLHARVNDLDGQVTQVQRDLAEQKILTARVEADRAQVLHRFEVLVDHHGHVVRVATDAGLVLPPPPPEIAHYLLG